MNLDRVFAQLARGRRAALDRRPRRSTRPRGEGTGYVDLLRSLIRRR